MRRIALLSLLLTVGGCGHNTWWNPPMTGGYDPNRPQGEGINLQRSMGNTPAVTPLLPEPGDIWPGPLPPMPTLQDVERETGLGRPPSATPLPGATPLPMPGSSSPPPTSGLPPLPRTTPNPTTANPAIPPPPARDPSGRIIQTPSGSGVTSGGTQNYQTTTTPGGGSAIVVPNGNGTSTVIHSDGRIETIPTPR